MEKWPCKLLETNKQSSNILPSAKISFRNKKKLKTLPHNYYIRKFSVRVFELKHVKESSLDRNLDFQKE